MASPEAKARRRSRAIRKLEAVAEQNGSEDQLLAFHEKLNQPTYGDPEEQEILALEASADLLAEASGVEVEEEDLEEPKTYSTNPQTGEAEEKKPSWQRVAESQQGQGPIPEDAEAGDAMSDEAAEGDKAASTYSEEEREALNEDSESSDEESEEESEEDSEEEEESK
jgi:hypothetical protein